MPAELKKLSLRLPPPAGGRVDLLVVAGEHSGDEHAARMVRGLLTLRPELKVCALGGPRLAAAGAQLLRDLTATSAIGPGEVLRKLSFFRALIAEIVRWIGAHRPRAVCFVDSSGLNLRIAEALCARGLSARMGGPTRTLYYISPQVWASRAERRFAMARHLDALAVIFPFEPAVYADTALPVEFVGHPFAAADYAPPVRHDPAGPVLLLPGSRAGAVRRIFPALLAGFDEFAQGRSDARAVVLYPSEEIRMVLESVLWREEKVEYLKEGIADLKLGPEAIPGIHFQKTGEQVAASAVLTSSGTMSLHCALAGIPGAVTYRADPLFYLLGRMLVKVKFIGIANLLLGEAMYPEYIQGAATPAALAAELRACADDPSRARRAAAQAARLRALLAQPARGTASDWLARQMAA
jgi:lipid-A-disaccharide synthase